MAKETLQKIKSSMNRGVTAISLKTSSTIEKARIKTHIGTIESEVQKMALHIGETAYALWEKEELNVAALEEMLQGIKEKKQEIAALEEELVKIEYRNEQILGAATASNETISSGQKEEREVRVCSNCGAAYNAPAKFCRKCGTSLE